ncbi:PDZ domain (Also known as DHR or GLGF) [compost metagenome]
MQFKFILKPLFKIDMVRTASPAQLAGLMKDDKILAVNGRTVSAYTLEDLTNLMKSEEGKEIVMKIERNGVKMNFRFTLQDPLPFIH